MFFLKSSKVTIMMKLKIGIVGGSSPQSTLDYYKLLIAKYIEKFNDHAYPEIIIYSVNFQNYIEWMATNQWNKIENDIVVSINNLKKAGADFAIIAAVTLHKVISGVLKRTTIPVLSILDCVVDKTKELGIKKIALLGTKYTMTSSFFPDKLLEIGTECFIPKESDIKTINDILYNELDFGIILDDSRKTFISIINKLEGLGAEGVILGCTEIPLLIKQKDVNIPLLDSVEIHVESTLKKSLNTSF